MKAGKHIPLWRLFMLAFAALHFAVDARGQFYRGSYQEFGKNRVQYDEFIRMVYKFEKFNVYYYTGGQDEAIYTAKAVNKTFEELEKFFDYYLETKIHFLVYNKMEHFRQSNIGMHEQETGNIGGVTRIAGSKVFIYFNGSHTDLENQVRAGMAGIFINHIMYGDNWKDMVKNSALLTLPDWYVRGLVSYVAVPWSTDIDSRVKDGIISGRYRKFNRLTGVDARYAGHALWNYIARAYGREVIPNILYMSRISRNVESGFLFVLGVSLNTLMEESRQYYRKKYIAEDERTEMNEAGLLPVRVRKSKTYRQLKVSPDGRLVAYATDELTKRKVYIYDLDKGRKRKVLRTGVKLERINDRAYPLLAWQPRGEVLTMIYEKKGLIWLVQYHYDTRKRLKKNIFKLEKVLDFAYAPNGKYMVFSAIAKGRTDIYSYKLSSNVQENLTNDIYDDLHPRFINGEGDVMFASNREDDTLRDTDPEGLIRKNKDLFIIRLGSHDKVLRRVSNTPDVDEAHPGHYGGRIFTYLSDKNGIRNRYIAHFDSVISGIDTSIHYRYVVKSEAITNYSRNILEHDFNPAAGKYAEVLYHKGKYRLFLRSIEDEPLSKEMDVRKTDFILDDERDKTEKEGSERDKTRMKKAVYSVMDIDSAEAEDVGAVAIDINNYEFEGSKKKSLPRQQPDGKSPLDSAKTTPADNRFITLTSKGQKLDKPDFVLPKALNYHLAFAATEVVSQFDFDFANQLYQRFNGGPYYNPGMGAVVKIAMRDLFEDYKIEGGVRYSFNNDNTEFFLSLINRRKRLDKKYELERQSNTTVDQYSLIRTVIHQAKYMLSWPFNEVTALRGTFNLRNDRIVPLSTDQYSHERPITYTNWAGARMEFIYDNTRDKGLNLYNGTRYKIFGESYKEIGQAQSDIEILGLDFRHYQKIHRELIWAGRIAASRSFGNRKLVYYMGGMDNWVILNASFNRWNNTPIATDQNYYFQTLATPMRGFIQNMRNGHTFALINNEIRWPVFRYLMNRPIKSDFKKNFQLIAFGDVGTAWTGKTPWSDDNAFNTKVITKGPLTITIKNQKEPVIGGYGLGVRSRLFGYFVRLDYAWGVEDGVIQKPITYFSLGLDF